MRAAILARVWLGVIVPNMVAKEASLARYPEWEDHRRRTGMLLPRILGDLRPTSTST